MPCEDLKPWQPPRLPENIRFLDVFLRFLWIFNDLYRFVHGFLSILGWYDSGLTQDMFKSYFLSVGHAAGAFFSEKMTFLDFEDMLNLKKLEFCSYLVRKTHIWGPNRAKHLKM